MRLNGWQRLWFFLGVIYLIPIVILILLTIPTKSRIYSDWDAELNRYANKIGLLNKKIIYVYKNESNDDIKNRIDFIDKLFESQNYESNIASEDSNYVFPDKSVHLQQHIEIRKKYTKELDNLLFYQIRFICQFIFFLWMLPLFILYLLGLSLGWIYRGFISN